MLTDTKRVGIRIEGVTLEQLRERKSMTQIDSAHLGIRA
jgi:hypothetical protein